MKVIIIDDEPIAQQILEKLSKKVPYLEIVAICDNAIIAIQAIQDLQPDLIFLDIQMPEMTGLEMLRILQKQKLMVILTTAFHEHALESYEFDVVEYLLKPISFERFLKAVCKADNLYKMQNVQHSQLPFTETHNGGMKTYVWANEGRKKVQICIEDIVVVNALKDYMELLFADNGK
jgi:DNA-binding LytR/AlgR family response regulator